MQSTDSSNIVKKTPLQQTIPCLQTIICFPMNWAKEIQEDVDANDKETFL